MKQIVCYGDSNTWGYDPYTAGRYQWGVRWTSILQEKLSFEKVHIIEEGLCGRTTVFEDEFREGRRGIETLSFLLESHSPVDVFVLMLGTNDCKSVYHANENVIGMGIESLLQVVRQLQPQAEILLISPIHLGEQVWKPEFDPEFDEQSVQVSRRLKNVYEEIAKKYGIQFLAASDYAQFSTADMEHMDGQGHERLAEAIYKKLLPMVA